MKRIVVLCCHLLAKCNNSKYQRSQAEGTLVCATLRARQTAARERQLPLRPPHIMEALYIRSWQEHGALTEEEEGQKRRHQGEEGREASSPTGSVTDEETDEDSEPTPPSAIRRKVSFADAFGLDLVSVKEFDNAEGIESDLGLPPEREETPTLEDFYMSCLFTVPSSPEELDQRLQAQMVELESIELLPGTTTIRGIIRVVNLCYSKSVYVRMSLDRWTSYFDLLAEYVPGSSDRKTDRFTFQYNLVPPIQKEGTRVELCLRYDTPVGTFWANNQEMNYVLFCHQKSYANELGPQAEEEQGAGHKSKRSCLRASRRAGTEGKTRETSHTSLLKESDAANKAEETDRRTMTMAEIQSVLYHIEPKPLVDSVRSRHREAHLARVHEYLQRRRRQRLPEAYSHDSASGQQMAQPSPPLSGDSAGALNKRHRKQPKESPRVLTYHEIPLLTLDWNNDKAADNVGDTPAVNDMWESFLNGADDTSDKETSVCDVWQAFLNESSCTEHSGVPESEWLQTAVSVSPSNDKEVKPQHVPNSPEREFQVGPDPPEAASHAATHARVALKTTDRQLAEACVSGSNGDSAATQHASERSQTNSPTDAACKFSPEGETSVSRGSVDSSADCHGRARWERQKGEAMKGGAEGTGGDEPCAAPTADLVTSPGESGTTDVTAMAPSQNASVNDRISQGARRDEGLPNRREGQVTGTRHNAADDTLAFRGTIRRGTKDEERLVSSTPRQGAEEGIVKKSTGKKVSMGEEMVGPPKTEECEISQKRADEKQPGEFRLNRNSGNPLQENEGSGEETGPAQSHVDEFDLNQTCQDSFEGSQIVASKSKSEGSKNESVALNNKDLKLFTEPGGPSSCSTTCEETKGLTGGEVEITQVLNEDEWWHQGRALQLNPAWRRGSTSLTSGERNKPSQAISVEEELQSQTTQENVVLKSEEGKQGSVANQTEDRQRASREGVTEEGQGMDPGQTGESRQTQEVLPGDHETLRPFPEHKCYPEPLEVVEMRWTHSQHQTAGQREDTGHKIEIDASRDAQRQPETFVRTEEDMSHRGEDERVSVGEPKIEALEELTGNAGIPEGERRNAPAQFKEQGLSAEVESSPLVEYKELSEGTKDPITAENTATLEVIELGVEKMLIERFGEDLVRAIWEEVFNLKTWGSNRDFNLVVADVPHVTREGLLFEKNDDDAFDSGVFSLTDLSSDFSHCQEHTSVAESSEYFPKERSQTLIAAEQTYLNLNSQTNLNLRAYCSQDFAPVSLSESAQSSTSDQERSVTPQEAGRQIKESVVTHKESFNQSTHPSHELKGSDGLVWWSLLFILSHITRRLICTLLVAGFFSIVYLCDFPAFFALYVFSLCWWFYKWKRHQVTSTKGVMG